MSLKDYIRDDQKFLIYLRTAHKGWEIYDPDKHGTPRSVRRNYVVAYLNGEILENRVKGPDIPPGTHYVEQRERSSVTMPECRDDHRIEIWHETGISRAGKYCTRVRNTGNTPLRIRRFAAFVCEEPGGEYLLSTITNDWFTAEQFIYWFNQQSSWIQPGQEVCDPDNYGFGSGYWVFDVEFSSGESVFVKSVLPG